MRDPIEFVQIGGVRSRILSAARLAGPSYWFAGAPGPYWRPARRAI